ncbi:hypothetical protein CONPUDRAFT_170019 [Coniophora puteana RWD-64-598 SS2]|uniref:Uncharacterized protein n=1 Tax=Coniophora puteana (strain RWD-64-598) TaxID=741705 RepID=R7SG04_CONPW|nr:uncharacterized protein CONPUDRAFT_170019 [Coniophora puteana RWD-64-598 SS2]EIW74672.1 hypothetical protein CONPUDRAFT_170019 [Coniophora puteana RWD-64-598 SS2]
MAVCIVKLLSSCTPGTPEIGGSASRPSSAAASKFGWQYSRSRSPLPPLEREHLDSVSASNSDSPTPSTSSVKKGNLSMMTAATPAGSPQRVRSSPSPAGARRVVNGKGSMIPVLLHFRTQATRENGQLGDAQARQKQKQAATAAQDEEDSLFEEGEGEEEWSMDSGMESMDMDLTGVGQHVPPPRINLTTDEGHEEDVLRASDEESAERDLCSDSESEVEAETEPEPKSEPEPEPAEDEDGFLTESEIALPASLPESPPSRRVSASPEDRQVSDEARLQ